MSKVPIQNEIAWSKNSAKYLALLGDFAVLQKQFAAIPGPGLRYSSDLLAYVPDNTVVYAAIPNLANTLGEASQLFQDRLQAESGAAGLVEAAAERKRTEAGRRAEPGEDVQQLSGR